MIPVSRRGSAALLLVLVSCYPQVTAKAAPSSDEIGFIKGMSWGWASSRGDCASPDAAESMRRLAETGAEWVCIAFDTTMNTPHDPAFVWGDDNTSMVSDHELRHAIDLAHENNLKVILKPVVNCSDGTWRAWIRFFRPVTEEERAAGITGELDPWGDEPQMREGMVTDLDQWKRWWNNYTGFLLHYAEIAQENDVEMFCLGCEMNSAEKFEGRWRSLIGLVREKYDGVITYDINHGREKELSWCDELDVIGVSAYYEVPPPEGVPEEEAIQSTTPQSEIVARLEGVKAELADVHQKWKKPIFFIETGVTNVRGCARYPWSHPNEKLDSPLDQQEQANYYRALFEVFWDEPWFMGFAWWSWPVRIYDKESAAEDRSFSIYGKRAEEVVREWYAKPR